MTCQEQVHALCEEYGELSILQAIQKCTRKHAEELDEESLFTDAVACWMLVDALDKTFIFAARIRN